MSTTTDLDQLTSQALALPPEQRFELAHRLWDSAKDQLELEDEELIAEIERRDAELESGAVQPIPFDQAMREIRDSLK